MANVLIFGAGDIARLAHFYFTRDTQHDVVGFAVDPGYRTVDELCGLPVYELGDATRKHPPASTLMFVALSYARMNRVRAEKVRVAKSLGYSLATYVSSRCTYLSDTPPGENCFILEDNTVQPFVTIGNNVTLWSGNHIGHDSIIEDHCFLTSHVVVSGNVRVKPVLLHRRQRDAAQLDHHRGADADRRRRRDHEEHESQGCLPAGPCRTVRQGQRPR